MPVAQSFLLWPCADSLVRGDRSIGRRRRTERRARPGSALEHHPIGADCGSEFRRLVSVVMYSNKPTWMRVRTPIMDV